MGKKVFALAGLVAVLVASLALAQGRPRARGPHGPGAFGFGHRLFHELELTDEQREQIRAIREQSRDQVREARRRVMESRRSLHDAALQGGDDAALRPLAEALGAAEAEAALLEARLRAEAHQVLTPEQRARFEELRQEAEERMEERMQERRERIRDRRQRN